MVQRILLLLVVVTVLVATLVYSQLGPGVERTSGFIEADEIRLGSRVGGRVAEVHVEEGDEVIAGQVLIELEPYDLRAREQEARATLAAREAEFQRRVDGFREEEVEQAQARVRKAQAKLDELNNGPRVQEREAARGRLEVAEAELKLAQQQFDRVAALRQTNAVPPSEQDTATEELKTASAMLVVRTQELSLLEAGTREEEIRQAKAELDEFLAAEKLAVAGYQLVEIEEAKAARDAARASLDAVLAQLEELVIRSPCHGFVETLNLQPGDLVPPAAPVTSLASDERLWIRAYLPQNRLGIEVGDRLPVTVDSLPDERFVGEVIYIARQAEFTPNNVQTPSERSKQMFRTKVLLREGVGRLRPGMSATVWLEPLADVAPMTDSTSGDE